MKENYTFKNRIFNGCKFFYLFNWVHLNEIDLAGYPDDMEKYHKEIERCLGVWKIKHLK